MKQPDMLNFPHQGWLGSRGTVSDPEFAKPSNRYLQTTFLTVGSLAHWFRDDSLIWGTGIIRANQSFSRPTETFAVRGPLTRRRFQQLGHPCPSVYGDPAILLPLFLQPVRHPNFRLGVIPHHRNLEDAQKCFGEMPDVTIIDVREELETVVSKICSCQRIVSSSLHGLIISHSYQIPARWIQFNSEICGDGVKFLDYYSSLNADQLPHVLRINKAVTLDDIEKQFCSASLPDISLLQEKLLDACPFRR